VGAGVIKSSVTSEAVWRRYGAPQITTEEVSWGSERELARPFREACSGASRALPVSHPSLMLIRKGERYGSRRHVGP
jgi:hypothetical protein